MRERARERERGSWKSTDFGYLGFYERERRSRRSSRRMKEPSQFAASGWWLDRWRAFEQFQVIVGKLVLYESETVSMFGSGYHVVSIDSWYHTTHWWLMQIRVLASADTWRVIVVQVDKLFLLIIRRTYSFH